MSILLEVAKSNGWRGEGSLAPWLIDQGFRLATLPDGNVVIRATKHIYTHVVCGSQDGEHWYVLQWTTRPAAIVQAWQETRGRESGKILHPQVMAVPIWGYKK